MTGRFILTAIAIALIVGGLAALFAPDELARLFDPATTSPALPVAIQLFGGGLLAFGLMDWMCRKNRIGGIYARPLGVGNLLLCTTAALALGKATASGHLPTWAFGISAVFGIFAVSLAWLVFGHDGFGERETLSQS